MSGTFVKTKIMKMIYSTCVQNVSFTNIFSSNSILLTKSWQRSKHETLVKFFIACLLFSSCASRKYSFEERIENNTFNVNCNVFGASVKIKSKLFDKEYFKPTSITVGSNKYSSSNSFEKLKFGRTILVVSQENFEPQTIKVWRVPRLKALGRDVLLGLVTYGVPLAIDAFRSDFYKVASWSRNIDVELKFTQEFMKKQFYEIEKSSKPEPFIAYINAYPYSSLLQKAIDKRDSTELLVAIDKSSESALDEYIATHQRSKFLKEATDIKSGIVEARVKFEETKTKNSVEAYEEYLAKYPKSLQKKEAIDRLVDVAYRRAINQNTLDAQLAFNSNYLMKYQDKLNADTLKLKTERTAKQVDRLIIKENDTDPKNKYVSFSKVWKKYDQVRREHQNLPQAALIMSSAYFPKIANLLLESISKLPSEKEQTAFFTKLEADFPNYYNPTLNPLSITLLENAKDFTGSVKFYNQKVVNYYVENGVQGMPIKELYGFEHKGTSYSCAKEANLEEFTLSKGIITTAKLYRNNTIYAKGVFNGKDCSNGRTCDSYECSYYVNGNLVRTNYTNKEGSYFYEFENGVNLSWKILENKLKEADAELTNKNYDRAIDLYVNNCANDYPKSIPLNLRLQKSIQNAQTQKTVYLQKLEQQRIAEEKRQEQIRLAEEKRQEQTRLAEIKKQEKIKNSSNTKPKECTQKVEYNLYVEAESNGDLFAWYDSDIYGNQIKKYNFYWFQPNGSVNVYLGKTTSDAFNESPTILKWECQGTFINIGDRRYHTEGGSKDLVQDHWSDLKLKFWGRH